MAEHCGNCARRKCNPITTLKPMGLNKTVNQSKEWRDNLFLIILKRLIAVAASSSTDLSFLWGEISFDHDHTPGRNPEHASYLFVIK